MGATDERLLRAALISGSPSPRSRSRRLLEAVGAALEDEGVRCELIELSALPSDSLLGRGRSAEVDAALECVRNAAIVAASTPVYRATYSGLLKVFFDLLEPGALRGRVGIAIASGGSAAHQLVIEHGLAPLFTSVGAVVAPTGVYGTDAALGSERAAREAASSVVGLGPDAGAFRDLAARAVGPRIDVPPALSARAVRAAHEAVRLATALSAEPLTLTRSTP